MCRWQANKIYYALITSVFCLLVACTHQEDDSYQGYVEGELRYIGTNFSGELTELHVNRGQKVNTKDLLFALESNPEKTSYARALSQLLAEQTQVEVLKIQLCLEELKLARRQKLFQSGALAPEGLDEQTERVDSLNKQIKQASANADAAKAQVEQTSWAYSKKQMRTKVDAFVYDTFFKPGEFVESGRPVLALLAWKDIKVDFFVPESDLGTIRIGQKGVVTCDGCKPTEVTVIYISPKAEFTVPIIYSEQTRSKLVFKIEAIPDIKEAYRLHPGQPISIKLYK